MDTTTNAVPCLKCGAQFLNQAFWLGSCGPYCGMCWNEREQADLRARTAALEQENRLLTSLLERVFDGLPPRKDGKPRATSGYVSQAEVEEALTGGDKP